ncbi:hypothetical protein BN7_5427 [Wickerhamomyces ciferrii]|uniref:Transcription factor domain-containing protein n=1 Tax=Wickerhamomyces ciferrii (strain ATCC 14091 / BCRC 22168 / CBS 111 / JCM 3599 / NBRC 0793 / NRRL Y-1031 F-60-10) TaxID=1206466 RepID=K0KRU3_WICCF|nr:uncharacterized protein BN7_5427 [Wickerhamomyces ciferrii]CCH45841.1 hypothetical protein BN7_5427 [Wickerhamomyces ciferrii]
MMKTETNKSTKCDKEKPICGTCIRANHTRCEYTDANRLPPTPDEHPPSPNEVIDIHRGSKLISKEGPLSFISIINMDPFIRNILYSVKNIRKHQLKIQEEVNNPRPDNLSPTPSSELFNVIKPYIIDTKLVWFLVNHFFDSEVYPSCSFISKESFKSCLINYIGPESFPAVRYKVDTPFDHIFLGTLLVIMRISSASFYNCGYSTDFEHNTIGPEVVALARRCYDITKSQYLSCRLEMLQLLLIINYYDNNAPEEVTSLESHETEGVAIVAYRIAMGLGLNLECETEHLKRLWYHIVQLDTEQFVRNGASDFFIRDESYTTTFPKIKDISTDVTVERFKVRTLLKSIALRITNVRETLSISILESLIRPLEVYLEDVSLDSIFKTPNKALKAAQFLNFMEISSVIYMVTYHICIHLTGIDSERAINKMFQLLSISNKIIPVTHFLNSSKEHQFNLQQQFGYSFNIIPKILQTLHKFSQLQISLTGRANFFLIMNNDVDTLNFKEMKRIAYQNSKMIIRNFSRIDTEYFFSKRIYKIQTLIFFNCFGTTYDSSVSQTYLDLLRNEPQIVDSKVFGELVELNKSDINNDQSSKENEVSDILNLQIDQQIIEELGNILETDSFLTNSDSLIL